MYFLTQTTFAPKPGVWNNLRVRAVGSNASFDINNTAHIDFTPVASSSGRNIFGLLGYDCSVDFDDIKLRLAMEPEVTVTAGAGQQPCQ